MAEKKRKLLVINTAALGWKLVSHLKSFRPAQAIFPAVTCPVQASFRTAQPTGVHGLVANGLFFDDLRKVMFWEQSAKLVEGPRIWENFRARGKKVGMMFWQQSLGEAVDFIVSPWPVHRHSGGLIQSCHTQPAGLEEKLNQHIGRPFDLKNYWGPMANHHSSDWIVEAICAAMEMPEVSPELLLTYIPHLDYDLQRYGPDSPEADKALDVAFGYFTRLQAKAAECGYDWLIFGDYAIEPATRTVFPNRALREAGLFATRDLEGMAYPDFYSSRAFAVSDHGVAHVHCRDATAVEEARAVLRNLPGVAEVLGKEEQGARGLAHRRSGELLISAAEGTWFAYPWFTGKSEAPDFATHVDIHNKPGYDPCELFWGWPPLSVSLDTTRIHGTHGSNRPGMEIAWSSSLDFAEQPATQLDLARQVQSWMEAQG
jgi:predicted AlkP superfamily pyrophosphatase or phosphodiesterase